jgi:hypothetical protein
MWTSFICLIRLCAVGLERCQVILEALDLVVHGVGHVLKSFLVHLFCDYATKSGQVLISRASSTDLLPELFCLKSCQSLPWAKLSA